MPAGMSLVQLHPLAENSLHLDLCTYIRWIYGIAVRSNASEDRAQRGD